MAGFQLKSAVWEITLACCFSCAYCGSGGGKARKDELTTDECLDVARQLAELGCRRVSMIGGEVFMRPDWTRIVSALTGRKVKVCVITNGFAMTEKILSDLKACGVESVAVSVDGPEDVHDAFRQKGSYARAMEALRTITRNGIPASVISALRADNAVRLEELYQTLKEIPIFAWQLQACSPMGNAKKNGVDVRFDAGQVIRFVTDHLKDAPFMLGIADNIGYYTEDEPVLRGRPGGTFTGCGAGITSIGIDSVGNVRGCESMYDDRFIEGNLRSRTLKDIWEDENSFAYNRRFRVEDLNGRCKDCPVGGLCAGGCRSYNFFTNSGNLYENLLCARKRQDGQAIH